jgi:hypothetical protein
VITPVSFVPVVPRFCADTEVVKCLLLGVLVVYLLNCALIALTGTINNDDNDDNCCLLGSILLIWML